MLLNCGVGEDSWESLGLKEIQPVHLKGDQSWMFIGRTDVEAETPILWPPDVKSWLIWKDPGAEEDWRWEEKGTTEDKMVSLTQWKWIWVNSKSWWWTGSSGMLQSMGSEGVRHDWVTELNWRLPPTWRMVTICWLQPHRPQTGWSWKVKISPSYLTINISEGIPYPTNFTFKNSSRKTIRESRHFEQETPILFVWLLQRTFSALNSSVWFVWPDCVSDTVTWTMLTLIFLFSPPLLQRQSMNFYKHAHFPLSQEPGVGC